MLAGSVASGGDVSCARDGAGLYLLGREQAGLISTGGLSRKGLAWTREDVDRDEGGGTKKQEQERTNHPQPMMRSPARMSSQRA